LTYDTGVLIFGQAGGVVVESGAAGMVFPPRRGTMSRKLCPHLAAHLVSDQKTGALYATYAPPRKKGESSSVKPAWEKHADEDLRRQLDEARRQRDQALQERDKYRLQRDEARRQRDLERSFGESLATMVLTAFQRLSATQQRKLQELCNLEAILDARRGPRNPERDEHFRVLHDEQRWSYAQIARKDPQALAAAPPCRRVN
jgi:hypothetical protein